MSLLPCPSCSRHVRRSETVCPFCNDTLALVPEAAPSVMPRLGRAALFTFGAAIATTGCVGSPVPLYGAAPYDSGPAVDAAPTNDTGSDATVLAMYGGPPVHDAGSPGPLYGAPSVDSGTVSEHDSGGASSDYGAPPPPPTPEA